MPELDATQVTPSSMLLNIPRLVAAYIGAGAAALADFTAATTSEMTETVLRPAPDPTHVLPPSLLR